MDSTSSPETISFTTPFPTGSQTIGGISACRTSLTTPVSSVCTCLEGLVSLYVALSNPTTRVDFVVHLIAPILGGIPLI